MCIAEAVPLRLGLELTCGDSNSAKILLGTGSHMARILRVLMSRCRKNSVRNKVLGKKWIYLDRNTHHRQSVWAAAEGKCGVVNVVW